MTESIDTEQKLEEVSKVQPEEEKDSSKRRSFRVSGGGSRKSLIPFLQGKKKTLTDLPDTLPEGEDGSANIIANKEGQLRENDDNDRASKDGDSTGHEEKNSSEHQTDEVKSDKQNKQTETIERGSQDQLEGTQKNELLVPPDINVLLKAQNGTQQHFEEIAPNIPENEGVLEQQKQVDQLDLIQGDQSQLETKEGSNILSTLEEDKAQNTQITEEKINSEAEEIECATFEDHSKAALIADVKQSSLQAPDINILLHNFNLKQNKEASETLLSDLQKQSNNFGEKEPKIQEDEAQKIELINSTENRTLAVTQEDNNQNSQNFVTSEVKTHPQIQTEPQDIKADCKVIIEPDVNIIIKAEKQEQDEAHEENLSGTKSQHEKPEASHRLQVSEPNEEVQISNTLPTPDLKILLKAAKEQEKDITSPEHLSRDESTGCLTEKSKLFKEADTNIPLNRADETEKESKINFRPSEMKIALEEDKKGDPNTKKQESLHSYLKMKRGSSKKNDLSKDENLQQSTDRTITSRGYSNPMISEIYQPVLTARARKEKVSKAAVHSFRESNPNSGIWEALEGRTNYRNKSFDRTSHRSDKKVSRAEKLFKAKPPSSILEKYLELKKDEQKNFENLEPPHETTQKTERRSPSPTQKIGFNPETITNLRLAEELKKYKPSALATSNILLERLQELQQKKAQELQKTQLDKDTNKSENINSSILQSQTKVNKPERSLKKAVKNRNLNKSLNIYGNRITKFNIDEQISQILRDQQLQDASLKKQAGSVDKSIHIPQREADTKMPKQKKSMTKEQFDSYYHRMVELETRKQEKLEMLKKQKEDEEIKKLSQKKKAALTPLDQNSEKIEPFHKRMNTYMKQKTERLEELRKKAEEDKARKEESELTFTPKINKDAKLPTSSISTDQMPLQTPDKNLSSVTQIKTGTQQKNLVSLSKLEVKAGSIREASQTKRGDVSQDLKNKEQNHAIPMNFLLTSDAVSSKNSNHANSMSSKGDQQGDLTATFELEEIPAAQTRNTAPHKPLHSVEMGRARTASQHKNSQKFTPKNTSFQAAESVLGGKRPINGQSKKGASQFESSRKDTSVEEMNRSSRMDTSGRKNGSPLSSRNVESVMNKYESLLTSSDLIASERSPTYEAILQKIAKMKEELQNKNTFTPTINPKSTNIINNKRQKAGQSGLLRNQSSEKVPSLDSYLTQKLQNSPKREKHDGELQLDSTCQSNDLNNQKRIGERSNSLSATKVDYSWVLKQDNSKIEAKFIQAEPTDLPANIKSGKVTEDVRQEQSAKQHIFEKKKTQKPTLWK